VQIVYHPFHKPSNPTYRSANFPKQDAQPQRTSNSQSFRTDKSMKTDYSLQEIPLLTKESTLPYYEPTKCSSNRNGIIKAYAANTN
jgi:protein phosphatase 2C family protein 2/3